MLSFDFKSEAQGEIQGIGFDTDDSLSTDRTFQLYGTQAWGQADFQDYASVAPGWKHYDIPVGQYYTGPQQYLFFVNDHDVSNPDAESLFFNVSIYEQGPPAAAFSATPLNGAAPLTVTFTNNSTNATSYEWNFGDGITSTLPSPTHTYPTAGVYTVSLTATGPAGFDTLTQTNYITVTKAFQADFSAFPRTQGCSILNNSFVIQNPVEVHAIFEQFQFN
ncbi:MAG: PKD domain-containing protein, partial [Anaerolineae bacterium]|nr:PKD domain-containing protein [Anaerolineae bacterium]